MPKMKMTNSALEYIELVTKIQLENRKKADGVLYYKHHILPRSLYPLLKHKPWNIILVTYQEHKMLHELLAENTVGKCQEVMKRDLKYFC